MENLFFAGWTSLIRTALITAMSYVLLIALLRAFGKRTLSKMNAFDLIVTIALGSTLASVAVSKDVSLADGATVFILLISFQFIITYWSVRSRWLNRLIKSTPTLLVYKGEMLISLMKRERIAEDEIRAIIREKGLSCLTDVSAVILETDGSLTVLHHRPENRKGSLKGVEMPNEIEHQMTKNESGG